MLVLFADTDCDITPKLAKEWGYELISMPYTIEGKEYFPYFSPDEMSIHDFYEKLRNGAIATTSAVNPDSYRKYFEPHFQNGDDILYVHFSQKMSGTFNGMNLAVQELLEEYPDRKFYEIDTKGITVLSYNICYEISKLYKAGKTIEEILAWADENIDKFAIYFFAEDLNFFKRSGRVSGIKAFFGTMMGVRPIMYMSSEGVMEVVTSVKGKHKAIAKLIEYVKELGDQIGNYKIVIAQCDAMDTANEIVKALTEEFGENLNIDIVLVNPTIGAHCGPSSVGICFHSIHR